MDEDTGKCGCAIVVVLFNLFIGTICVNYLIWVFFEKQIPLFWAGVIALFGGELLVPVAIVTWILKSLGVF
jgi:hypothetical protein